jgi:hypothetical protein
MATRTNVAATANNNEDLPRPKLWHVQPAPEPIVETNRPKVSWERRATET